MIIDALTRLWTGADPFSRAASAPASPARHASSEFDVAADAAFLVGFRSDRLGVAVPTGSISARVSADPAGLAGFAGIDPLAPTLQDDLAQAADAGMVGVALSPADQGCRPTHERFVHVLEWAASRGIVVMVSNPGLLDPRGVMEFARPSLLDEACRGIPGLKIVLGDIGHAWADEALLMCARHKRVFIELSTVMASPAALTQTLTAAHERGLSHRLLFASGAPAMSAPEAIERVYALIGFGPTRPPIPREVLRSIVERDTFAALGIERAANPGRPASAASPAPAPAIAASERAPWE